MTFEPKFTQEKKLLDAYHTRNFEHFENIVRGLRSFNPTRIVVFLMFSEYDDYRYLKTLLDYEHTTVNCDIVKSFLRSTTNHEIVNVLLQRMYPKTPETIYELVDSAVQSGTPEIVTSTLCQLLKDGHPLTQDRLAWLLYTKISSEETEDPSAYIRAFVNGGVDIRTFHYILPEYLRYGKIVPGVARELIKHGIPKSAAYVTEYLKSEQYRMRLLMEL